MDNQEYKAPEGYRFPFPTSEDAYSYDDYLEDCNHFSILSQEGVELREIANRYFQAHYPPVDRAQRCLNLFWSIESFLSRLMRHFEIPDKNNCVRRWDRGTRASWEYYAKLDYGDDVKDNIVIEEIVKTLLNDD